MFDYNDSKNISNKKKHGVSLEDARSLWDAEHIIIPAKNIKDEKRYLILGMFLKKVHAAVFTYRKDKIRLISFHRADTKLERFYYEKIK